MFKWKCYFYDLGGSICHLKISRGGWFGPEEWDSQSPIGEVNGTFLKRALCWTGWSSIVNTSFPCLTRFPSNRKTEMRPCRERKKKKSPWPAPDNTWPTLAFTLYSQKTYKSKNNFRCFPFLPGCCHITQDQMLGALEHYSTIWPCGVTGIKVHIMHLVLEIIKQTWGERWFSFLMFTSSSDYNYMSQNPGQERKFNF